MVKKHIKHQGICLSLSMLRLPYLGATLASIQSLLGSFTWECKYNFDEYDAVEIPDHI